MSTDPAFEAISNLKPYVMGPTSGLEADGWANQWVLHPSVSAACKLNGYDPGDYLRRRIESLPDHLKRPYPDKP